MKSLMQKEGFTPSRLALADYPISWGHMDYMRHVNNVQYLRFFESARINAFNDWEKEALDTQQFMSGVGIGPIMRSCELAWRYPMRYPDTISVAYKVSWIGEDRFGLKGIIISHNARKVAARIDEVLVTVNYDDGGTYKVQVPEPWQQILNNSLEENKPYVEQ